MKRTIVLTLVAVALASSTATAEVSKFGLGVIVGEPTGVNAKLFLAKGNALDFGVAWSLSGNNDLHIQVDYLYHRYDWISVKSGRLPVFFGLGGRIALHENADDSFGIRIPVGLAYEFAGAPFDIFGELVPTLALTPDTDFDFEGAIGARFWF